MKQRKIKILKLMEAIQNRPEQSQRELAGALDLSLGLVNKLLKELSSQGFLELNDCGKSKVKYALTQDGAAWQEDLKKQHLKQQINSYEKIKEVVGQGLAQLKDLPEDCSILFYGAGVLCEIACMLSSQSNTSCDIKIIDDRKAGNSINGYRINKEAEIRDMEYDAIIVMDMDNINNAYDKLKSIGIPSDKIMKII